MGLILGLILEFDGVVILGKEEKKMGFCKGEDFGA